MKKSESGKKNKKTDVLLILAILLFVIGLILLLIDPIRRHMREKKTEEGLNVIEAQISENIVAGVNTEEGEIPEVTFIVPRDDNAVNGEEYDIFADTEEERESISRRLDEEYANMPEYVTLRAIGLLNIESVDIHISIWDEASTVSLRYGGGHFETSVMPGEVGNCSILAHHMRDDTMFHNLDQVQIGDEIEVIVLDGTRYIYVVDEIKIVHAWELDENLIGDITDTRQITLVTCSYTATEKMRLLVIGHIAE